MKVLFRADASRRIGGGHVMRCHTIAVRLQRAGAECAFVCATSDGNLIDYIRAMGFPVIELPGFGAGDSDAMPNSVTIEQDARRTRLIAEDFEADWIVVDHYAFDESWESFAVPEGVRLLVLDDLADRNHQADVLVDQNLGRAAQDYQDLVPSACEVLAGSRYTMLREEFLTYREVSLQRRQSGSLSSLLISFGGADNDNVTGRVLDVLIERKLHQTLQSLIVVLGSQSAWKEETAETMAKFGVRGRLLCGIDNMAEIMSSADLSIGGGGTTAWERCCLGVPSLLLSIAENQIPVCTNLEEVGAALYLGDASDSDWQNDFAVAFEELLGCPKKLAAMSRNAELVCDGMGVDRLVSRIFENG